MNKDALQPSAVFLPAVAQTVIYYKDGDPQSNVSGVPAIVEEIEAQDPPCVKLFAWVRGEGFRREVRHVMHAFDPVLKTNPNLKQWGTFDSIDDNHQRFLKRQEQERESLKRSEAAKAVIKQAEVEKLPAFKNRIAELWNENRNQGEIAQIMSNETGRVWLPPRINSLLEELKKEGRIEERKPKKMPAYAGK